MTPDFKSSNASALPYGCSEENSIAVIKLFWFLLFAQCVCSYSNFWPGKNFTCEMSMEAVCYEEQKTTWTCEILKITFNSSANMAILIYSKQTNEM